MIDPVVGANRAIRELSRLMESGEITEDEFKQRSLPFAQIIADAHESAQSRLPAGWRDSLVKVVEYAERDPAAIQAIVAGLVHGLGHYLRSSAASE